MKKKTEKLKFDNRYRIVSGYSSPNPCLFVNSTQTFFPAEGKIYDVDLTKEVNGFVQIMRPSCWVRKNYLKIGD